MNRDTLTWIILGVLLLVVCYLIYYTQSEGYKCMVDATKYAQDLVRTANGIPMFNDNFNLSLSP